MNLNSRPASGRPPAALRPGDDTTVTGNRPHPASPESLGTRPQMVSSQAAYQSEVSQLANPAAACRYARTSARVSGRAVAGGRRRSRSATRPRASPATIRAMPAKKATVASSHQP